MTEELVCFWIEPTDRAEAWLRRYERHAYDPMPPPSCPANPMRYHDTSVLLGEIAYTDEEVRRARDDEFPHDDPRWPGVCDTCGTAFRAEDHWQYNVHRLYRGAPDGKLYSLRRCPPGSMYDASPWYGDPKPDGINLMLALPPEGGDDVWNIDGYARGGGRWERTGKIPKVSVTPSILTPRYHGILTGGVLRRC